MRTAWFGLADNHVLVKLNIRSRPDEQYFLRTEAGCQLFSNRMRQINNLNGKEPSPQQYQQRF